MQKLYKRVTAQEFQEWLKHNSNGLHKKELYDTEPAKLLYISGVKRMAYIDITEPPRYWILRGKV